MALVDLTHSTKRKGGREEVIPVVVRSSDTIDRVPLERLVTPATVIDLTRRTQESTVSRLDVMKTAVADIGGCILRTNWCDRYLVGDRRPVPELTIDAASYLLEGGVRTVASDFPVAGVAADLLLHNNCILVHCLSGILRLSKSVVQLIALPLKLEDAFSADARVIAIE